MRICGVGNNACYETCIDQAKGAVAHGWYAQRSRCEDNGQFVSEMRGEANEDGNSVALDRIYRVQVIWRGGKQLAFEAVQSIRLSRLRTVNWTVKAGLRHISCSTQPSIATNLSLLVTLSTACLLVLAFRVCSAPRERWPVLRVTPHATQSQSSSTIAVAGQERRQRSRQVQGEGQR